MAIFMPTTPAQLFGLFIPARGQAEQQENQQRALEYIPFYNCYLAFVNIQAIQSCQTTSLKVATWVRAVCTAVYPLIPLVFLIDLIMTCVRTCTRLMQQQQQETQQQQQQQEA